MLCPIPLQLQQVVSLRPGVDCATMAMSHPAILPSADPRCDRLSRYRLRVVFSIYARSKVASSYVANRTSSYFSVIP